MKETKYYCDNCKKTMTRGFIRVEFPNTHTEALEVCDRYCLLMHFGNKPIFVVPPNKATR